MEIDTTTEGFVHGLPLCDRKRYAGMANETAAREYLDLTKSSFHPVHGGNATRARAFVSNVLISRGVRYIDNLFGPIEIRP